MYLWHPYICGRQFLFPSSVCRRQHSNVQWPNNTTQVGTSTSTQPWLNAQRVEYVIVTAYVINQTTVMPPLSPLYMILEIADNGVNNSSGYCFLRSRHGSDPIRAALRRGLGAMRICIRRVLLTREYRQVFGWRIRGAQVLSPVVPRLRRLFMLSSWLDEKPSVSSWEIQISFAKWKHKILEFSVRNILNHNLKTVSFHLLNILE